MAIIKMRMTTMTMILILLMTVMMCVCSLLLHAVPVRLTNKTALVVAYYVVCITPTIIVEHKQEAFAYLEGKDSTEPMC